jgi:cell division protein FtsL
MSALLKPKYEYAYEEQQNIEQEYKKRVIKKKKKNKLNLGVIKTWFMILTIFVMGISIIYNYATITEKKMAINNLDSEIAELNNKIDKHNIYLESLNNTNMIENMAKSYLGMSYPTRKQTVFINSESGKTDDTQLAANQDEEKKLSILEKTYNYFVKR